MTEKLDLKKLNILYLDDVFDIRYEVSKQFEKKYKVNIAIDDQKNFDKISNKKYDIIIADTVSAVHGNAETYRKRGDFKGINKQNEETTIVLLTSQAKEPTVSEEDRNLIKVNPDLYSFDNEEEKKLFEEKQEAATSLFPGRKRNAEEFLNTREAKKKFLAFEKAADKFPGLMRKKNTLENSSITKDDLEHITRAEKDFDRAFSKSKQYQENI
ncbi:MAG: hypothetical protein LBI70_04045 [Rickettsiales bacterium]|jgi:CheY-like chemotaxis protein|nr:hypothetical protein [Rickettsiales bacterium]